MTGTEIQSLGKISFGAYLVLEGMNHICHPYTKFLSAIFTRWTLFFVIFQVKSPSYPTIYTMSYSSPQTSLRIWLVYHHLRSPYSCMSDTIDSYRNGKEKAVIWKYGSISLFQQPWWYYCFVFGEAIHEKMLFISGWWVQMGISTLHLSIGT